MNIANILKLWIFFYL